MKVSFSFGPKSAKLIESMSRTVDDIEFSSYDSVRAMVEESTTKHKYFDRIVFSEKILEDPEIDLNELNDYLKYYADSTEVVIVCNSQGSKALGVFNEVFNSPLFTPVLVDKVTIKTLLEFVVSSISELKTKYYVLEEKKQVGVTSKSVEEKSSVKEGGTKKPAKKGFLGGLFSKRGTKDLEEETTLSDMETTHIDSENNNQESENFKQELENPNHELENPNHELENPNHGLENPNLEEYNSTDDLSIGHLGGEHVDTGFLDGEGYSEIDRYFAEENNQKQEELEVLEEQDFGYQRVNSEQESLEPQGVSSEQEESEQQRLEEQGLSYEQENEYEKFMGAYNSMEVEIPSEYDYEEDYEKEHEEDYKEDYEENYEKNINTYSGGIHMLVGSRDITLKKVFEIARELEDIGKEVLVVDCDYIYNSVLSQLDIEKVYAYSFNDGLYSLNPYSEENISYLVNGFGTRYDKYVLGLERLVRSDMINGYDVVLVYCPLDCVGSYEDLATLGGMNIHIFIEPSRVSIIGLISILTNTSYTNMGVHDLLYEKAKIELVGTSLTFSEDMEYLRRLCLFSRGNWLDKIK